MTARDTVRMLLMLKIIDDEAIASLSAPLVEAFLHTPLLDSLVRACLSPVPFPVSDTLSGLTGTLRPGPQPYEFIPAFLHTPRSPPARRS